MKKLTLIFCSIIFFSVSYLYGQAPCSNLNVQFVPANPPLLPCNGNQTITCSIINNGNAISDFSLYIHLSNGISLVPMTLECSFSPAPSPDYSLVFCTPSLPAATTSFTFMINIDCSIIPTINNNNNQVVYAVIQTQAYFNSNACLLQDQNLGIDYPYLVWNSSNFPPAFTSPAHRFETFKRDIIIQNNGTQNGFFTGRIQLIEPTPACSYLVFQGWDVYYNGDPNPIYHVDCNLPCTIDFVITDFPPLAAGLPSILNPDFTALQAQIIIRERFTVPACPEPPCSSDFTGKI